MSDEMVMRTTDSPAVATGDGYGAADALVDYVRDSASPDDSEWALNSEDSADSDGAYYGEDDSSYDVEADVRQRIYDNLLGDEPAAVPYERFREVNEQARSGREYQNNYEKWADVISQLESQGFQSAADVQAALQQQQLAGQETAIRQRYAELEAAELLHPEVAQAQAEAEVQKFRYDRVMNQMSEYMVSQQRQEALDAYPYARRAQNMVDGLIQSGMNPYDAAALVHDNVSGLVESIVPELTSMIQSRSYAPTPIDTSYSNQQAVVQANVPQPRSGAFSSISRLLGIGGNPNSL